jgi:hypothetical protein
MKTFLFCCLLFILSFTTFSQSRFYPEALGRGDKTGFGGFFWMVLLTDTAQDAINLEFFESPIFGLSVFDSTNYSYYSTVDLNGDVYGKWLNPNYLQYNDQVEINNQFLITTKANDSTLNTLITINKEFSFFGSQPFEVLDSFTDLSLLVSG